MTAQDLKIGDRFQYRQTKRWSNNFGVKEIVNFPELNNLFIYTTAGRTIIVQRDTLVKVGG
jgi:hypothetical protein